MNCKNSYSGCSLGIGDWRILHLLYRILRLTCDLTLTDFYSDMEPLSKYSPVTLHLSPATRILNENLAYYYESQFHYYNIYQGYNQFN